MQGKQFLLEVSYHVMAYWLSHILIFFIEPVERLMIEVGYNTMSVITNMFESEQIHDMLTLVQGKLIKPHGLKIAIALCISLFGYLLSFGRDTRNRNKNTIDQFKKLMSDERDKLLHGSAMDLTKQKNAFDILYPQLFFFQKIRMNRKWKKYIEIEQIQKHWTEYWPWYDNKNKVLNALDKLLKFK